jgi:hypothetical protein
MDPDNGSRDQDGHEPYGFMERELAFKLLASHALVDGDFYTALQNDPERAAAGLHIRLTDEDIDYIANKVEWAVLTDTADDIREALHLDLVTNSW